MTGKTKNEIYDLIVNKGINDPKKLSEITGLSINRIYELRKELDLNQETTTQAYTKIEKDPVDYIPAIKDKRAYISRRINGKKDIEIIEILHEKREPILIIGETGTGKTHCIREYAYKKRLPYMRVNFNGATTPEDLIGQWTPDENGGFKWQDGVLTTFVRNGGVFVVDEINSGNAEILFFLHPLLDDEKKLVLVQKDGEVLTAHKDFWFVSTMNPDYEGTKPLNIALQDRFRIIEFDYEEKIEKKLLKNHKLIEFANKIRKLYKEGEITMPVSTRTLLNYEEDKNSLGETVARELMLNKFKPEERNAIREVFELEMGNKPPQENKEEQEEDDDN